jgi:hypothetical protein
MRPNRAAPPREMEGAGIEALSTGTTQVADGYGLVTLEDSEKRKEGDGINRDILGFGTNSDSHDECHCSSTVALLSFAAFLLQAKTDGRVGQIVSGIFFPSERGTL